MARQVKCRECEEKQQFTEETMTLVVHVADSGKEYKKYFHNECLNKYNEKQVVLNQEQAELDALVEIAGQIHNAPKPPNLAHQFPRIWYHVVQDFRNGTARYTKNFKRRYKKGIPYSVIAEAYKLSKDGIKWAIMDKKFKDSSSEARYCLAIVSNKIPDALKKADRDASMEKVNKVREEEELENMSLERETVYQKKKLSHDISELFED